MSYPIPSNIDPRIAATLTRLHAMNHAKIGHLSIEELAQSVNLSQSHFRGLFARSLGTTPARYMKLIRLERADLLIRESFMTIKEVMAATGFADDSHFVRDYKALFGCSPSARRAGSWANR